MKDYLTASVQSAASPLRARNDVREYLQARILGVLQRRGAMVPLAFHGGTALRFLFSTARYSEDLDFCLEGKAAAYDFRSYLKAIEGEFMREGYEVNIKLNDKKTVHSAFIRFPGLVYELGLSPHRAETISVRLEVDTKPPAGAILETAVVRRHVLLRLQHHDKASLLAGKLHAVFERPYLKGRDIYDLVWYLSDPEWPEPNMPLLNNALRQTGWTGRALNKATWRAAVRERLRSISYKDLVTDVATFLEQDVSSDLLSKENIMRFLE